VNVSDEEIWQAINKMIQNKAPALTALWGISSKEMLAYNSSRHFCGYQLDLQSQMSRTKLRQQSTT
jgi:hypothetical protein